MSYSRVVVVFAIHSKVASGERAKYQMENGNRYDMYCYSHSTISIDVRIVCMCINLLDAKCMAESHLPLPFDALLPVKFILHSIYNKQDCINDDKPLFEIVIHTLTLQHVA